MRSIFAALATVVLAAGCATTPMPTVTEPVVDRPGQHLTRYRDRVLEVVVDTEFAQRQVGDEWIPLNVAFAGSQAKSVEIDREQIWLRTPEGDRIPLPTYQEFRQRFNEISALTRRVALAADPLDFSRADRRPCVLAFHPLPGTSIARDSLWVNQRELCSGIIYFAVPGGAQPGTYQLVIELEERDVRIPFALGR